MIDDYVFLEVLLIELEWLPPSDYSRWECGLVKSLIYKQRIGIRGETLFRSVDRSGSISFLSLLENRELMRVWERSNFPILFENYETICEPSLIITLYDRKNWFLLNNCNDNEWMKCKTRYKKKKKKRIISNNFLQSRKRLKKNHKNFDTIPLRKRNLQSNFWNVFHSKETLSTLGESLFHRKHPWKISPRSPLSQNFHKTLPLWRRLLSQSCK